MNLKTYLTIVGITTAVCWFAWFMVLAFINPATTGWVSFVIFYFVLCLSLVGTFSLLGFGVRFIFNKDELAYKQVNVSFRQSLLLALIVLIVLFLQSQRFLFWWNIIILVFIFSFIELFFLAEKK